MKIFDHFFDKKTIEKILSEMTQKKAETNTYDSSFKHFADPEKIEFVLIDNLIEEGKFNKDALKESHYEPLDGWKTFIEKRNERDKEDENFYKSFN